MQGTTAASTPLQHTPLLLAAVRPSVPPGTHRGEALLAACQLALPAGLVLGTTGLKLVSNGLLAHLHGDDNKHTRQQCQSVAAWVVKLHGAQKPPLPGGYMSAPVCASKLASTVCCQSITHPSAIAALSSNLCSCCTSSPATATVTPWHSVHSSSPSSRVLLRNHHHHLLCCNITSAANPS